MALYIKHLCASVMAWNRWQMYFLAFSYVKLIYIKMRLIFRGHLKVNFSIVLAFCSELS